MTPFHLFGFFLIIYGFINYKKSFLLYLTVAMFFNQNINLINLPGLPLLSLDTTLVLFYTCLHVLKGKKSTSIFPFKKAFILLASSEIISMFFSIAGIGNTFTAVIKTIFEDFILVFLIWDLIETRKDILLLIKRITISFLIIGLYGIYEGIIESNPIADYVIANAGSTEKILSWDYSEDIHRGYRVKSFFLHAIGGGINFAMFSLLTLYLFKLDLITKKKYLYIIAVIISVACILLTKSRGPIVFFFIALIPVLNLRSKYFYYSIISGLLLITFFSSKLETQILSILSIFDSKASEVVGGSNVEMRFVQLAAAIQIFLESPIIGLGQKATFFFKNQMLVSRLLGMESIWFWIIIEKGIVGIATYLYLFFTLVVKMGKRNKYILYFSLAYFITETMTSTPGMNLYLFYLTIILLLKSDAGLMQIKKQQNIIQ